MNATGRRHRGTGGFTFLEVMVSLTLISFLVAEMAMLSIHASRSSTYSQRLSKANLIAEGVVERARNTAFENVANPWTETVNGASVTESCTTTGVVTTCTFNGYAPLIRTRTVEYKTTGAAVSSYTVEMNTTVSWTDARGQTQRIGVTSVISKF
jgi:type II secretory pathway pseudopilin PulG